MLAWNIMLTIIVVFMGLALLVVYSDLYKWIGKLDKLLKYNPYDLVTSRYHRDGGSNPYDSTPEFIKGIKNMAAELDRPFNSYGISKNLNELDCRVDRIAEDLGGHDNRLDEYDSNIRAIRSSVEELDSELTRRVDNLEKFCYGTMEVDNATEGS